MNYSENADTWRGLSPHRKVSSVFLSAPFIPFHQHDMTVTLSRICFCSFSGLFALLSVHCRTTSAFSVSTQDLHKCDFYRVEYNYKGTETTIDGKSNQHSAAIMR